MRFLRDGRVGVVLKPSCIAYTLKLSARRRLALAQKSLFFEAPNMSLKSVGVILLNSRYLVKCAFCTMTAS